MEEKMILRRNKFLYIPLTSFRCLPLELNERAAEAAKLNDPNGRVGMHSAGFGYTVSQKELEEAIAKFRITGKKR